jgi:alanine racemase
MSHQQPQFRPTYAEINLDHLAHNFLTLKGLMPETTFFCPMVKANGYGHGDFLVAKKLQDCGATCLGVGLLEEAILLRQMGIKTQIILYGLFDEAGAAELIRWQVTPVISLWEQFFLLNKVVKNGNNFKVHVKFDTGMSRLGFSLADQEKIFNWLKENRQIQLEAVLTHLHSGEDADDLSGQSFTQLKLFKAVETQAAKVGAFSHTLNSAGFMNFVRLSRAQKSLPNEISLNQGTRPGLAVYGYSPLSLESTPVVLKPVMNFRSRIVKINQLSVGQSVSYGARWRAQRDSLIGVIPVGYADGYHRVLSNQSQVLIKSKRVPVIGSVCMDYFMVDLTDLVGQLSKDTLLNESVTLFGLDESGQQLSAKELADLGKTITWEVLTSVGERVPRVIKQGSAIALGTKSI